MKNVKAAVIAKRIATVAAKASRGVPKLPAYLRRDPRPFGTPGPATAELPKPKRGRG